MPVEDALILISRNFEAYMKGEQFAPENAITLSLNDRHPSSIQVKINNNFIIGVTAITMYPLVPDDV